jgi:hypothetical protein
MWIIKQKSIFEILVHPKKFGGDLLTPRVPEMMNECDFDQFGSKPDVFMTDNLFGITI